MRFIRVLFCTSICIEMFCSYCEDVPLDVRSSDEFNLFRTRWQAVVFSCLWQFRQCLTRPHPCEPDSHSEQNKSIFSFRFFIVCNFRCEQSSSVRWCVCVRCHCHMPKRLQFHSIVNSMRGCAMSARTKCTRMYVKH